MAVLKCLRCRDTIKPDEPMICVVMALPQHWSEIVEQLDVTPGRWHFRCAPIAVRGYAPATLGGTDIETAGGI